MAFDYYIYNDLVELLNRKLLNKDNGLGIFLNNLMLTIGRMKINELHIFYKG